MKHFDKLEKENLELKNEVRLLNGEISIFYCFKIEVKQK